MRVVGEPEAAAGDVGLAKCRRMKVLRLHGSVRRNGRYWVRNAIADLGTAPEALGVELGLQTVAGKGDAVGRHPMLRIGERAGEIERPRIGFRIDARLKGVAAPAAEPLGKAPAGAAAGERKADDGARRKAIIQTASASGAERLPQPRPREQATFRLQRRTSVSSSEPSRAATSTTGRS